jgi:hypothetical protein
LWNNSPEGVPLLLDPETEKVHTDGAYAYHSVIPPEKHKVHVHKDELNDKGFITSTHTVIF